MTIACPACNNTDQVELKETYQDKQEIVWQLIECCDCGVQFWHSDKSYDFVYETDQVFYSNGILQNKLAVESNDPPWHLRQFLQHPPHSQSRNRTLLDIGCGEGLFLSKAAVLGYKVWGIDPNPRAIQMAREYLKLDQVFISDLNRFARTKPAPFDVVTAFEVLEHQKKPREFLDQIKTLLKPGGYFALSLPNRLRYRGRIEEPWDYPPHHWTRWDPSALRRFLESAGFQIIQHRLDPPVERLMPYLNLGIGSKLLARQITGSTQRLEGVKGPNSHLPLIKRLMIIKDRIQRRMLYPLAQLFKLLGYAGGTQYALAKKKFIEQGES